MDWHSTEIRPSEQVRYVMRYVNELVTQGLAAKLGAGALAVAFVDGFAEYAAVFWIVVAFWGADMILGTLRAWRDPKVQIRYSRALDGVARLVVIVVMSTVLVLAEVAFIEASTLIASVDWDPTGKPMLGGLGVMAMQEAFSIVKNASYFYPGLHQFRARLITWVPGEDPQDTGARAVVIEDRKPADPDPEEA